MQETAEAITARLNDLLRTKGIGGEIFGSPGVSSLSHYLQKRILKAVADFKGFEDISDPCHRRNFGAVDVDGRIFFFKIEAYDPSLQFLSEDPNDPDKTCRIMTIMCADEY